MKTCRYFRGDRPCKYYWVDRSWDCDNCLHHNSFKERILLIKLDALGDVVRSTALVEGIKSKYPDSQLNWITVKNAYFFISNNPQVDNVLIYSEETIRILQQQKFDIIINLDKDPKATSMIMSFNSNDKRGYGLSGGGYVIPLNEKSKYHYDICLDNYGGKTDNKKSYQELIYEISEIDYDNQKPSIFLDSKKYKSFRNKFFKYNNLNNEDKIVILNTGCGSVYPHKKWTYSGYKNLIGKLIEDDNIKIVLAGAEIELERNSKLCGMFSNLINTTNKYSIEEFCYLINLSDIVVTGDTVALHVAISLNKNTVSFFGPTPHQEVNLFGLGKKLVRKELDCLNCYDQFPCPYDGKCMSLIKPEEVYNSILKYI
jgi:heptosyltransferase-2|tara:strand:+ start:5544 stop:6656 length:1113 start_codon:yes stop_codon:yes gene_type:complete